MHARLLARPIAVVIAAALLSVASPAHATTAGPAMRVHDLGTLGGATSNATAMNERGQVVGSSLTADGTMHAFSWTPGHSRLRDLGPGVAVDVNAFGTVVGNDDGRVFVWASGIGRRDLGTLGGARAEASDLNDRGQVAGVVDVPVTDGTVEHAFRWDPRAGLRDLGIGRATAINERGQVAGTTPDWEGFFWDARTGRRPIVLEPGAGPAFLTSVSAINDRGQVVGGGEQAFIWDPRSGGRVLDMIGTEHAMSGDAFDVNASGVVVGRVQDPLEDVDHAFVWTTRTGIVDLTTGPAFAFAAASTAINDRGHVVGWTMTSTGPAGGQGFLWRASSGLQPLGTLGGDTSTAVAVNNHDWVAGSASTSAGAEHAAVWVPVPRG